MLANDNNFNKGLIMRKNFTIESRKDFRFSLYSRNQPIGLGDSYCSIMKQRVKDKDKVKVKSI